MRFSASAILAVAAIGVQALPQDVQPITQISDGQIQAPPATAAPVPSSYEVPSVPAPTEVLPSVTPVPLPSVVPSSAPAPVVPSSGYSVPVVPVPSGSAPPYPISSGAIYTNGTVAPTGGASTSAPAAESSTGGSSQPTAPANSGAATNMVSFAALFAGLVAYLA